MAWLAKSAGLDTSDAALESRWLSADAETRERALLVLTTAASAMLSAGVAVSIEAWLELTEIERVALTMAGRRVAIERATLIGQASRGQLAAARLYAEVDGGEAHDDLALDSAMAMGMRHMGRN
jgi:hypothetical protein